MPRELITIQIGQCGNQIGWRFWDIVLREHAKACSTGLFDESMSSFFRNVDTRFDVPRDIPLVRGPDGRNPIRSLKARAILIDMEEGVVSQVMKGPLRDLFDQSQFLTDVSGSGNNWAHGFSVYGPKYHDDIVSQFRTALECCDSPQSFFLMHSLGGGTGSGLGSYILQTLEEEYPEIYRFAVSVFPSDVDDVITSPYNATLALHKLIEHADCVLPIENQALIDMVGRAGKDGAGRHAALAGSSLADVPPAPRPSGPAAPAPPSSSTAFDAMNSLVAHMLTNLTASMRFEGSLNVDLNEITTNLVPFPRLHFLTTSLAPMFALADLQAQSAPKRLDQMFTDSFASTHQLLKVDPRRSKYLACGLLLRGDVVISDVQRSITRIKKTIQMVHWNQDGFKIGLCAVPSISQPYSLLGVSNNCCFRFPVQTMHDRFMKLYSVRAHVHHYTSLIDADCIAEASESLLQLVDEYTALNSAEPPAAGPSRMKPLM